MKGLPSSADEIGAEREERTAHGSSPYLFALHV
jgi:hypothetical protein